MSAIETSIQTKRYGETVAVDSLDLAVESGDVYGCLGPNGAGTTTMRVLTSLARPTIGSARHRRRCRRHARRPVARSPARAAGVLGATAVVLAGGELLERVTTALWFTEPVSRQSSRYRSSDG